MARKDPTPATLKALFAKSGNRCAYPNCAHALVDDLNIFVGEVCHIHAVNKKDARYDANKTDDELRGYGNLILMCHAHHKRSDTREDLYPADRLRRMKAEHEAKSENGGFGVDDSLLAQMTRQVIQDDWYPHLEPAIEDMYGLLNEFSSQPQMNRVSRNAAEVADAQLFITYSKLFQTLRPKEQIQLYQEQGDWMEERDRFATSQIESHGGSLAPLEYTEAFREFTGRRIHELSSRLKAV